MAELLLGRLDRILREHVPPHLGWTVSVRISHGLRMKEVVVETLLAEPQGGNINALSDEVLIGEIERQVALLPKAEPDGA